MDTGGEPAAPPDRAEPDWVRWTPLVPEQWWGPPAALAFAASLVIAVGAWLLLPALPVALVVGGVGLAGSTVLAVVGRRAYWYPNRTSAERLHRTKVVVWCVAAVALAVFGLSVGAQVVVTGLVVGPTIASMWRRRSPTRFELRARASAAAAVALASIVFAVVAWTVPAVDGRLGARWIGWSVVIVPAAVVVAVLRWRAAGRQRADLLSDPGRTGS
ncbi:hypothetical protein Csp2054_04970 [Curtobacterium sp. 'Ferrero']|uniref:hypothetical protein n=1 Tax=Curtobacterium sp. 'Ferrero' TaxID=2033654 RepID=UPI000BD03A53|nr:hypothetical protein [Curtobacterium sp. 'Ferrero']PCN48924.1 hypothetical protein Csp2054_04970 [Curtobacterium sp. 'Ferrero']